MGFVSEILSDPVVAVGKAASNVVQAVAAPMETAVSASAKTAGGAISDVMGPNNKNAGAIGAVAGTLMGDPLSLTGLTSGSQDPGPNQTGGVGAPTPSSPIIVSVPNQVPSVVQPSNQAMNPMQLALLGGGAFLAVKLLGKGRK